MSQKVRRAQLLSTYGPGAVIDLPGLSAVVKDCAMWDRIGCQKVSMHRLETRLRVSELRQPPEAKDAAAGGSHSKVPCAVFPKWMFCPVCRSMVDVTGFRPDDGDHYNCKTLRCRTAEGQPNRLVPVRWMLICEQGHLGDIPWNEAVHSGQSSPKQRQCREPRLRFKFVGTRGGGLASISVECATCKAKRTMSEIHDFVARGSARCPGKQPWEQNPMNCMEKPLLVERGATNAYYPFVDSALDIPPESDGFGDRLTHLVQQHETFPAAKKYFGTDIGDRLIDDMARELGEDRGVVASIIEQDVVMCAATEDGDWRAELRTEEWLAFLQPPRKRNSKASFLLRDPLTDGEQAEPTAWGSLLPQFEAIRIADKLREVRVLRGFSRVYCAEEKMVPANSMHAKGSRWLPAYEVFGEGVFFRLCEDELVKWENLPEVFDRIAKLRRSQEVSDLGKGLPIVTPRLVLLHTLSHLIMREMALTAGYSAASLGERIYSGEAGAGHPGMAGVLIYTAAGDSEGTLGGLARLGETGEFVPIVLAALQRALFCSLDPVCRELPSQGMDGLNLAACHACALLPETSCEWRNCLLDRALVVSAGPGVHPPGFLDAILHPR